jgi:hypothetical protein
MAHLLYMYANSPPVFQISVHTSKVKRMHLKRTIFLGLIFTTIFNVQMLPAQHIEDSSILYNLRSVLKLTLSWNFGPEWEKKITKTSSVILFAGPELGIAADGFSFSNANVKWQIEPDVYAEYRNYYNLSRRNKQQKKTFNNSANFLFGRMETYLPVKNQNYFNLLFIEGCGAQRCVSRKITVDFHLGITEHFYYDKQPNGGFNYTFVEPMINFSVNYVF